MSTQHSHDTVDWSATAGFLAENARADADWYAEVAASLLRPDDRLVVDFGCGAAGMARALWRRSIAYENHTRVIAADANPEVYATEVKSLPQVAFVTARFEDGADGLKAAFGGEPDLIWERGAVHHADDPQRTVDVLAELLAPGGRLALAEGGLGRRHLPADVGIGRPGLEDRLNGAQYRRTADLVMSGVRMPYGWPTALRRAGLNEVRTRNHLVDNQAPLRGRALEQALTRFGRFVEWNREFLDADDAATWDRLLDRDDEAWLGRRTDLFHLEVRTVHVGRKGK